MKAIGTFTFSSSSTPTTTHSLTNGSASIQFSIESGLILNDALCTGKKFQKAIVKYYEITDAGIEKEVYRVTMNNALIATINFSHAYIGGSKVNSMLETISLRYSGIEWFYLPGMIKYSDSWDRNLNSDNKSESSTQR